MQNERLVLKLKDKKTIIEVIICNLVLLLVVLLPMFEVSFLTLICLLSGVFILDILFILLIFKYKLDHLDFAGHRILQVFYYLSLILILFSCLFVIIEPWIC